MKSGMTIDEMKALEAEGVEFIKNILNRSKEELKLLKMFLIAMDTCKDFYETNGEKYRKDG